LKKKNPSFGNRLVGGDKRIVQAFLRHSIPGPLIALNRPDRAFDVHPVEEQHIKVDVEVEGTTEALDQSDRAGSGRLVNVVCFSDQMANLAKLMDSVIFIA